ncbi:MAG: aminopeptidase [Bacilli bacterium]|nr:aminopeptidase [Bacilli bacterium]
MDERLKQLSNTIVNYSVKVSENDRVLIQYESVECNPLIKCLIKDIYKNKGIPFVKLLDNELSSLIMENADSKTIDEMVKMKTYEVDNFDCFIRICYTENEYEDKDVPVSVRKELGSKSQKIDDIRINQRRWVLLNYPSLVDAYKAKMKYEDFYEFSLDVMNVDYKSMNEKIKPLKDLMEKTDKVKIVGPDTDIEFSIKGMPAIPCCGTANIPDGELYTAPIKESVNGFITYNTPSPYRGNIFNNIRLEFKDGQIVNCSCTEHQEELKEIFDTDEGARYIGEFSLGFNPMITKPMGDILYDEKIMGSLHFTPGRCYEDCDNGNVSAIHWDLVLIQTDIFGGGEIYFDDVLIRKDGKFVLDELKELN